MSSQDSAGMSASYRWRLHRNVLLFLVLLLLLLGAMVVGLVTGEAGETAMKPFAGDLFKGACNLGRVHEWPEKSLD